MKRVLLIASALLIVIAVYRHRYEPGNHPGPDRRETCDRRSRPSAPRPGSFHRRSGRAVHRSVRARRIERLGVRRPPHLVQGHRRQRSLPHLHVPAAHRRAGRLVPRAAHGPARRPLRRVGHHQRSRLLQARRSGLSRQESRRDLRLRLVSRRRRAAQVRRQARLRRSGVRAQGRADRSQAIRTPRAARSTSGIRRAISSSARRPARSGLRKFPNPRFDAEKWRQLNGGNLANWDGFRKQMIKTTGIPSDERVSKLADASYEPPFLIGTTCGSCHIAFDPLNPPEGSRASEVGEHQGPRRQPVFADVGAPGLGHAEDEHRMADVHARAPGRHRHVGDLARPGQQSGDDEFDHQPRRSARCSPARSSPSGARRTPAAARRTRSKCWCEPGRDNKCWVRSTRSDDKTLGRDGVHHILKGGEDSIGGLEAIQRVYFNIGSCAEACWVNHLTDFRQVDPVQRGFGQTSFASASAGATARTSARSRIA